MRWNQGCRGVKDAGGSRMQGRMGVKDAGGSRMQVAASSNTTSACKCLCHNSNRSRMRSLCVCVAAGDTGDTCVYICLQKGAHPAGDNNLWGTKGEVPSFLYAMPLGGNRVFLEVRGPCCMGLQFLSELNNIDFFFN